MRLRGTCFADVFGQDDPVIIQSWTHGWVVDMIRFLQDLDCSEEVAPLTASKIGGEEALAETHREPTILDHRSSSVNPKINISSIDRHLPVHVNPTLPTVVSSSSFWRSYSLPSYRTIVDSVR